MQAGGAARAPDYRADIDGLRAIAVLAVVAYHFFPRLLPAGFAGVDVFFVISGYLISGIILDRVKEQRFSLLDFYARRIRRIFPALAIVLVACIAIGWKVLYFDEFEMLGRHVAAGAGFATNIVLWSEVGYFDPAAETKPLLHLWSLGVEEQFYLVWPVVLALACRTQRTRWFVVAGVCASSFVACVWWTPLDAPAAFYLPVFRFWELMAGAVLAVRPEWQARTNVSANLRSWIGLALLVTCAFVLGPGRPFPGWRAAVPVLASVLLLSAGPGASVNRALLSVRPLVFVGLISYPLYLWHWPLLTFVRILSNGAELTAARGVALFAVCVVLAWLTWRLIELPIRTGTKLSSKAVAAAVLMACVGFAGAGIAHRDGLPDRAIASHDPTRFSRDPRAATDIFQWVVKDCRVAPGQAALFRRCERDGRGTERFALIGDSKAEALWPGIVRTSGDGGRWLFMGGSTANSSVQPLLSDRPHYARYAETSRAALHALEANKNVETVVIVTAARAMFHLATASSIEDLPASPYFADALEGYTRYVKALVDAGKKVVIVVDNPTFPDPTRCLKNARVSWHGRIARFFAVGTPDVHCEITIARQRELAAQYRRLLQEVQAVAPARVQVFDTEPYLCDVPRGICHVFEGETFLYSYADHISEAAGNRIGKALNERLTSGSAQ